MEENTTVIEETTSEIVETSEEIIQETSVETTTEDGTDIVETDSTVVENTSEIVEEEETEETTEEQTETDGNNLEELLAQYMQAQNETTETVSEVPFMKKPLNTYNTQESLLVVIAFILAMIFIVLFTRD